ncbi:DUF3558 family protein [Corynebacterium sp. J010B-136]|uniref:DUF3558 family protein n=1 Tax=Corynebacterium sp. J010B-136 TaxID=2099401 RepID=UPI000CFA689B|nr:DUF3558 family protein [Corynebacterium sp. J010B-136]PQM74950.1 DUF3558 domain-containing protein [Corynebacterium sp. J010B-136]
MNFHGTTPVSFDLSAFKQKTLRKLYLALALISAAIIQTACSATISASESASASSPDAANDAAPVDAATEAPPLATTAPTDHATDGTTDEFGSVIPPLGTFDRRDPDFIRYQPCLEMPDEFLAEADLHGKEMLEGVGEVDGICSFESTDNLGTSFFNLHGSSHSFDTYLTISGEFDWDQTSDGFPILMHRSNSSPDRDCLAGIETESGTLAISFQSFNFGQGVGDPCDIALNKLKTVLELDGKHEN